MNCRLANESREVTEHEVWLQTISDLCATRAVYAEQEVQGWVRQLNVFVVTVDPAQAGTRALMKWKALRWNRPLLG